MIKMFLFMNLLNEVRKVNISETLSKTQAHKKICVIIFILSIVKNVQHSFEARCFLVSYMYTQKKENLISYQSTLFNITISDNCVTFIWSNNILKFINHNESSKVEHLVNVLIMEVN